MKTDIEIKESILARREKYLAERRRSIRKIIVTSLCIMIVLVGSIGITAFIKNSSEKSKDKNEETADGGYIPTNISISDYEIKEYGEVLTDDEIDEYYKENKTSILSGLSSSGVSVFSAVLSDKGYSHVKVEETQITLNASFRDRLLYNGNKLVAIITFVKYNGRISCTPSFGGTAFDKLDEFLSEHKGQKLTFGYIGHLDFAISDAGEIFYPFGYNSNALTKEIADKIAEANCEKAIYVP